MSLTWKLAFAYAVRHPTRMLLTSLAMIASACIVVWVVSGYDALLSQFGEQAVEYLGRYDFFVVPEDAANPTINSELVALLRGDPMVAEVEPATQLQCRIINPDAPMGGMGGGPGGPMGAGRQRRGGSGQGGSEMAGPGQTGPGQGGQGQGKPGQSGPSPQPAGPQQMFRRMMLGSPTLVGTDALAPPYQLIEGRWIDADKPDQRDAVLTSSAAESINAKIGDEVLVIFGMKEYRVKIVGVIGQDQSQGKSSQPMSLGRGMRPPSATKPRTGIEAGPASSAMYVTTALAKYFSRDKAPVNLVNIRLKPEAKSRISEFRKTWEGQIAKARPVASLLGVDDIKSGIEEGMMARRSRQEAWAATGMSLLAALFIIFTTLSMGVTERVRQFAVMRAVGLTRGQVARIIAAESIILALIGWGGGLLAGRGLLAVVAKSQTGLFQNGASLGWWCIMLTGLSAFGGALAASILPAWRAMSVDPLEAMSPRRSARPNMAVTAIFTVVGLMLISINPILLYVSSASVDSGAMSSDKLYAIYAAAGCSTMAIGFLLLTPAMILIVEGALGPWLARLLGLEPRLLRSQLGGNLWRTLGTTAALTVGLGLFVAMQIWGYSMLEPFMPGDWHPDMLVSFQRGGLPDSEIAAVQSIDGVRPGRCIPLAVEQPKLASDMTGSEEHNSVIRQNNVIMIGLDPQIAFGGDDPLVKARFVEGSAAEAIAKLKQGRNCIVPDHFLRATKLKLGDKFSMVPPETPTKRVEYTIVGAVSLPGWHWMTKFSGLRRREGRSAAMVFADYDTVRRDFNLNQINFFWLDVDRQYGEKHLEEVRKLEEERKIAAAAAAAAAANNPAGNRGGPMMTDLAVDAKRAAVVKIGEALKPIADRNMGEKQPVNGQGAMPMGATMFGESVRISTPDEIRVRISARASGMIWASCYLPLITLIITSLGVVNTVMASVRARRWEFGVLRALGVTRSALFRMILAEGILIGLITCLLSLGFGVLSGWCGTGISQYVSFFGGLVPPLVIPWSQLSIGFGIALGLCLLAALWPAVLTGRARTAKTSPSGTCRAISCDQSHARKAKMKAQKSIELLNKAVAEELATIHQYMYWHFHLDDQGFTPLAGMLRRIAIVEMGHLEILAERILFLKGDVEMVPAHEVEKITAPEDILRRAAEMENAAVELYNDFALKCAVNADSASKQMFETLVNAEELHYDEFDKQLDNIKRFGPNYLALQSFANASAAPQAGA